jgi:phospholipase C
LRADVWGPGTRVPAILISKKFDRSDVSHKDYDTTSIIKMIEQRFDLAPLVKRPVRSLAAALHGAER